jgi:hypothetical protein
LDWLFAKIFDFIAYLLRILVVRTFVPDDLLAKKFEKATCLSEAVQFVRERGDAAGLARLRLDVHVEGVEAPVVLVPLLAGYGPTVSILVSMFLWKLENFRIFASLPFFYMGGGRNLRVHSRKSAPKCKNFRSFQFKKVRQKGKMFRFLEFTV